MIPRRRRLPAALQTLIPRRRRLSPAQVARKTADIQRVAGLVAAHQERTRARATRGPATDTERIADLEQRLGIFEAFFKFGVSTDGLIPWCMTMGRFGIMTRWWNELKWGLGAAFSIGTITDWCGCYSEVEDISNVDRDSTPFFGWIKVPNARQNNLGIELHVANQAPGKVAIVMLADGSAIQIGGAGVFHIGKSAADARQLWP